MLSIQFLTVLCLGVLAVQAKPQLKNQIDDLVRDLEELNRTVTEDQQRAVDSLQQELKALDTAGENVINKLGEDVNQELAALLLQISGIQERAYELGVDIKECLGNSVDLLSDLPNQYMSETGQCVNEAHSRGQLSVDEAVRQVTETSAVVDELRRLVERCRNSLPYEQEACITELNIEISNNRNRLPVIINSAVQEAVEVLDVERAELLSCGDGKVERFDQEGKHIVNGVVQCAENKFPAEPTPFK